MTIRILPPDEAAKKAKERVAEWKKQREIDSAKARIEAKKTKPEPEKESKRQTTGKKSATPTSPEEKQKLDTKLVEAVASGDIDAVKGYIAEGADVDTEDKNEETVLEIACREGHKEIVKLLLENGAGMRLALHFAASYAQVDIIGILLDRGADINARDSGEVTPLFWAADQGNVNTVALLLERGADANLRGKHGETALERAKDNIECRNILIKHGATK